MPHYLERNTDAESSLCIGERKETPIKRLEDAIHSLNWPSGETQLLDRGKKHPKDTHQIAGEDILFSNSDGPDAQTD